LFGNISCRLFIENIVFKKWENLWFDQRFSLIIVTFKERNNNWSKNRSTSFLHYNFKFSMLTLKLFFSSSGHPTFKCPLCQESNFTRQRLLDHCNSNHLFQIVPVVSMCVYDSLLFKECCSIYFPSCVQGTVVNLNLDGTLSVRYILSSKDW